MNTNTSTQFQTMDLAGSQPTSIPMELIEVEISSDGMVVDYAKAFCREAYRVNPRRAEQVDLTEEELVRYADFLLDKRIETIQDNCKDWRKLKSLYVPAYLQYVMSMIGEVIKREFGLKFTPVKATHSDMSLEEAYAVSEKIGSFEDCLQIVQDAMPRDKSGDPDVMSTALIAGYVRSTHKVGHPAATYVTAFLKFQLRKEAAFKSLYRVQYDDVQFIEMALTSQKGLF